jgi:hypothetical protein
MRWKLVCASSFRSPCSPGRLVEKPWKGIRLLSKPLSSVIPSSPLDWIDASGRLVSLLRKYLWTGGDAEFGGSSAQRLADGWKQYFRHIQTSKNASPFTWSAPASPSPIPSLPDVWHERLFQRYPSGHPLPTAGLVYSSSLS